MHTIPEAFCLSTSRSAKSISTPVRDAVEIKALQSTPRRAISQQAATHRATPLSPRPLELVPDRSCAPATPRGLRTLAQPFQLHKPAKDAAMTDPTQRILTSYASSTSVRAVVKTSLLSAGPQRLTAQEVIDQRKLQSPACMTKPQTVPYELALEPWLFGEEGGGEGGDNRGFLTSGRAFVYASDDAENTHRIR